jgi:iron complex outermembrane receptor protein
MTNCNLRRHAARLLLGSALAALGGAAFAQNEIITVTGTSIRGQAPVGAAVIQIDRNSIAAQGAQTAQQLLSNVPQLAGFGNAAQGGIGSFDGAGTQAPTIHSLGASASNSTLVLIDGHRIPLSGLNHTLADPSIIPAAAIQRVEILPDGASSIYGSDAMAGVLNFITRKDYDGWETSGQYGFGDSYSTAQASQLFGHGWDGGSLLAVYNYSNRNRLANGDRDFITARQDLRRGSPTANPNTGGSNFADFNCSPATIATGSAATSVFAYPYTGTALPTATAAQAGICDRVSASSALAGESRQTGLVSLRQSLDDRLSMNLDLVYSSRVGSAAVNRGTLNAVAFGPTATTATVGTGLPAFFTNQRNPFYVGNATTGTTSEFVRYDFEDLFGHGAYQKSGATDVFATLGLDYDVGGGWVASLGSTFGNDLSFQRTIGQVNGSQAILALNGTTQTTGNAASNALADPFGLGTVVTVTRALTSANALDVWNPAATNRTSDAVKRSLLDSATNNTSTHNVQDVTLKVDGPLLTLPAGDVKVAVGGEYIHYTLNQANSTLNATGPASTSSRFTSLKYNRTVYAAFAEFVVPLVSEDMGIPLVQKLLVDLSGRYDNYSDFGTTENPKVGLTWNIVDGLIGRATYGTSFTAPALTSVGQPGTGVTGETSVANNGATNGTLIPTTWTNSAGTWVNDAVNCAAGGKGVWTGTGCQINTNVATGIQINGGNARLQPSRGLSYTAGVDINAGSFFDALEGLNIQFTYWQAKYTGLITAPAFDSTVGIPQLQANTVFAPPGGWTATSPEVLARTTGRPLNAALPATIWYIFDFTQQNAFNIQANGIDWSVDYRLPMDDMGTFTFSNAGGQKLRFDQNSGPTTGPWTNFLNGVNRSTTFNAIAWTMRTSIGWSMEPFSAQFSWNFVNAYHARNSSPPYNAAAPDGSRLAGYEHISALNSFDLNLGYTLPEDWISGARANLTITNLFDVNPPFSNQINGYDGGQAANGNPLGRVVTIGITKKW